MNLYPNPCSRCGACCISTPCPAARMLGAGPGACPFLHFSGEATKAQAECVLLENSAITKQSLGIGEGCCIKATAVNQATGETADFASLPPQDKRAIVARAAIHYRGI
jgi:hypothetical protein